MDIKLKERFFKQNGGLLLQQMLNSYDDSVIDRCKLFSSKELDKATNHFNVNRILGQGGQGTVYKGMLEDGRIMAVKKSKLAVDDEELLKLEEFINEIVILSQINHRNVHLHDHHQNEEFPLTWEIRLRIATEVAGALSYLHSAASSPIYHRDIKSTNILLDERYRAKVADFGTSKFIAMDQTHVTTKIQGTFGYLEPEYRQSSQLTDKSDVYSFGVVLVELLTGKKPIFSTEEKHMHVQNREREAANLPDLDPPDPTRPATLTRTDFTFPTTVLAELGTESRRFAAGRLLELTAVELDSGVVAARWSSPPVPLNSA
ncbi:hypothetical protein WN943_006174 [Citrus x changshan-huyou]